MPAPYFVDQWFLWSSGELRTRRVNCASLEEAYARMASMIGDRMTTRVRISKRVSGRNSSALKIWHKDPACNGPGV